MSLLLPLLFNIVLEVSANATREERKLKGIQIGKEDIKLSLFIGDIIIYVESPKESTTKPPGTNKFCSRIARYKINRQKSIIFLYISNEQLEFEIKNTILFTLPPSKINISV